MNAQAASAGGESAGTEKHVAVTVQQRKAQAKLEYQHGVNLYAAGALLESLAAFERAYEAFPHYTVLFNIGQIRGKLGRPVEANHALRQFLEQGENRIDENLRRQAQQAIQVNEQRIGRIQVVIDPSDAQLLVDGSPRDAAATDIQLALGPHVLMVTRAGYLPRTETVEVLGGTVHALQLRLEALIQPKANSWLRARCSVPGVSVAIDDRPAVRLNRSEHFQVESGVRRVRFERSGYGATSFEVLVGDARVATADCGLKRLSNTPKVQLATLSVSAPRGWLVLVDEEIFKGEPLPAGPHHVKILRGEQVIWAQDVTLVVGETRTISPPLSLPPRERAELRDSHSTQTVAYIAGGIGLTAIAGGGLALGLGAHRYSRWEKERNALATGQSTDWAGAVTHAAEIQRLDGLGVGLGVAGLGLVAAAVYLLTNAGHMDTRTAQVPAREPANAVLSGTF